MQSGAKLRYFFVPVYCDQASSDPFQPAHKKAKNGYNRDIVHIELGRTYVTYVQGCRIIITEANCKILKI